MIELGQLERRSDDFARRNLRVIVASIEGPEEARQTQAQFPHLVVLADPQQHLAQAAGLVHAKSSPDGRDTSAPTTILIDRRGIVRWLFRPDAVVTRLTPDEVLQAADQHLR